MTRNSRFVFALFLGLSLLPVQGWTAFAADSPSVSPSGQSTSQGTDQGTDKGPGGDERHHHWCKDDPQKCKERHEQWCKDNPAKCEARKKHHEEWCKDHPDKCAHDGDSSSKPSDKPSESTTPAPETPAPSK